MRELTRTDRSVFLQQFLLIQAPLRSYLLSLLRDPDTADEAFQEVSLALWEQFEEYDASRPFIKWAFGIARNHAMRQRDPRTRRAIWLSPEVQEKLATTYADIESDLSERRKALQACVEKLGPQARELLELRYEKKRSLQDIAGLRNMTLNAVNKALGKIRAVLSDCTALAERRAPENAGGAL